MGDKLIDYNADYCRKFKLSPRASCEAVAVYRRNKHAVVVYEGAMKAPGIDVRGEMIEILHFKNNSWTDGGRLMTKGTFAGSTAKHKLLENRLMQLASKEFGGEPTLVRNLILRLAWRVDGFCTAYKRACLLVP